MRFACASCGAKKQQRAANQAQQKCDQYGNFNLELKQFGPEEENAVGEVAGEQGAMRHGKDSEGLDLSGNETQAAEAIRMGGKQAQFDARHLPEKAPR